MSRHVITFEDADAFAEGAANALIEHVTRTIDQRGGCRLAISGGTTPRPVYERLSRKDAAARVNWAHLNVFWTDERAVPPSDPSSNYRLAFETWLQHVPLPASQIHRIEGERPAAEAVPLYAETLGTEPLDLVVLGMGTDGHTASLFPGTVDQAPANARVVVTHAPVAPHTRISLSLAAINASRTVHFWVAGHDKRARVTEVFEQIDRGRPELPAARVRPASGDVWWYVHQGDQR